MHKRIERIILMISVILSVADLVSDIVLGVNYCVTGHYFWCGLTWAFIAGPVAFGGLIVIVSDWGDHKNMWDIWKVSEMCLESAPQLLLQLYVISLAEKDQTEQSGICKLPPIVTLPVI